MKNSQFLTEILEAAKKVGDKTKPPVTAERFLVALMDKCSAANTQQECEEMTFSHALLKDLLVDWDMAKAVLLSYIAEEKSFSLEDDLYMRKRLQEAHAYAIEKELEEVNAVLVLGRILKNPSNAIAPILVSRRTEDEITYEPKPVVEEKPRPEQPTKPDLSALVTDVKRIREALQACVVGQDNAINVFTTGYFQAGMLSLTDKNRKRPRATFLFAGPPGVGKTFLAEQAAVALKLPFMRFDMSEYADNEAHLEFCGTDKVYKNGKSGNVTGFVAQHPKCILLFDEIEKAHIGVIHLFLQILDAGRVRDNFTDEEVSFTDAIIILTTNAGKALYEQNESGDFSGVSRKVIVKALQKDVNPETGAPLFPGAICSRFASGNVVMFNHIGAHNLRGIAKREIQRQAGNLESGIGIRFDVDEHVYTALLFSEGSAADARTIRGRAETFFNDELYELLRLVESQKINAGINDIEQIRIAVDLSNAQPEVAKLFVPEEKVKVLVFSNPETVCLCQMKAPNLGIFGAETLDAAVNLLKKQDISCVLLDWQCEEMSDSRNLNIEDVESESRDFFKFLREQAAHLPVYLLETEGAALGEEERISFLRQGVRGVLPLEDEDDSFGRRMETIALNLHQQAGMIQLARENRLVSFETAQTISKSGKCAEIILFDFSMGVAVDSEDAPNILSAVAKPDVHFEDVIGGRDAKKELTYFVEYLKNPKKYLGTGVKPPKGVILYGPPGTGKTMLAKAMACEAGVTFIAAEGNQFLKKYVGEGSEKVHELFRTARKYAPAILFIDEIDAIAKERKGGSQSTAGGEETLTAFLTEMDGFVTDPSKPVFVLAATNFDVEAGGDKSLDPALMRRFDRRVYMALPNKGERIRFLNMKILKNPTLAISEQQIENIALRATGMSLAQLDSVLEFALRSAIREGSTVVDDAILEEAFETFNSGEVKKWNASQLERVARHEAGHALLCWLSGETPSYLTVVARGNHGGYMQHAEQEGKAIYTKEELLARIRTSLGGRAAEIVCYGPEDGISTGAAGDLAAATRTAQQIVCTYGMDKDFGLAVVQGADVENSPEIRAAVNRILTEQMRLALSLISENRAKLDALVAELMENNHLSAPEISAVLS